MRLELVPDDTAKAIVTAHAPMGHAEFTKNDRGLRIVTESGATAAAIVFSDYRPHFGTVELSFVALHSCALSTQIVADLAAYAFGQLTCNRVCARTSSKNARARKLLRHIGFTPEGTSADFYGVGLHAETYRMLKREWEKLHGEPLKVAA